MDGALAHREPAAPGRPRLGRPGEPTPGGGFPEAIYLLSPRVYELRAMLDVSEGANAEAWAQRFDAVGDQIIAIGSLNQSTLVRSSTNRGEYPAWTTTYLDDVRRAEGTVSHSRVAVSLLQHVLARGTPAQRASPPTRQEQVVFAKTALEIGAGDEIRERLVLGHLLDGELAEAARRYEAIIQASPGQEGALLRRMGGLFLVADVARARDAFERAVAAAPTDGDAWLGLGLARARLGDRAGCREALARAIAPLRTATVTRSSQGVHSSVEHLWRSGRCGPRTPCPRAHPTYKL